jgi:hypothetical protein
MILTFFVGWLPLTRPNASKSFPRKIKQVLCLGKRRSVITDRLCRHRSYIKRLLTKARDLPHGAIPKRKKRALEVLPASPAVI